MLGKHYVRTRLRAALKRDSDIINFLTFQQLLMRSCLIDELKQRLLAKPGKEWDFSIFQPRVGYDNGESELKKLIYGNLRLFKPVKHV